MKKITTTLFTCLIFLLIFTSKTQAQYDCGETFYNAGGGNPNNLCQCGEPNSSAKPSRYGMYCCGFMKGTVCSAYEDSDTYGCGEKLGNASVPDGANCNCDGGQWTAYFQYKGPLGIINNRGICCGFVQEGDLGDQCLRAPLSETNAGCGEVYDTGAKNCVCGVGSGKHDMGGGKTCCGWNLNGECSAYDTAINNVEVDGETLNNLNPIKIGGGNSGALDTPGAIISRALQSFIFPIAGLILFVVLLLGGFQMLAGAASSKGIEEGKQKITAAIIGFILLFAAYWIAQLLELIFGIRILS